MSSRQVAVTHPVTRVRSIPWIALSYFAIGLIALLPRVLDLGGFITVDEQAFWITRSHIFLKAVLSGDYARTALTEHPGVTTMWLGAAGVILQDKLMDWQILRGLDFPTALALIRLPAALVHTLAVLVGYGLLRRMLPALAAAVAAFLWATDPFLIGYSRVLHTDALAATFAGLSLLAACAYWHHGHRPALLVFSGICGGLGFLSKSPALAVIPAVTVLVGLDAWRMIAARRHGEGGAVAGRTGRMSALRHLAPALLPLFVWGAIILATIFVCWPAMWVDPLQAYDSAIGSVASEGGRPHHLGNYFMGQEDIAPGPLFYPLALALRMTPWTLVGVLALPFAWRRVSQANRRDLAALACFIIVFTVAMTIFPKKFNRYLAPAFPAVDVLAAVGLVWLAERRWQVVRWLRARSATPVRQARIILGSIALLAVANVAWWHPYSIAYFNQALGGHQAGAWAFSLGWGEGMEQVAAWLNQQPDITGVVTVSRRQAVMQPYMREGTQSNDPSVGEMPENAGYLVVYIRQVQRGDPSPPFNWFYKRAVPLHVIRIHGVDYAWIYRVPPPVAQPRPADFGDAIRLRGFEQQGDLRRGGQVLLRLFWEPRAVPAKDYMLFAHLIGPDGKRYAQADLPYPTSSWHPGHYPTTELPITLPAEAPAGTYQLAVGLYDPASGQRLPLRTADPANRAADSADALLLAQWTLR